MQIKPLPHPFEQYCIRDDGVVVSFVVSPDGRPRRLTPDKKGYVRVVVSDRNRRYYTKYVHRLVAEAFVPNPEGLPDVDHINGQPRDNRACNLRWVTHKQNLALAKERLGQWRKGRPGKAVIAKPLTPGQPEIEWPSARAFALSRGNHRMAANVSKALRTGRPAYGYTWRYKDPQPKSPEAAAAQSLVGVGS